MQLCYTEQNRKDTSRQKRLQRRNALKTKCTQTEAMITKKKKYVCSDHTEIHVLVVEIKVTPRTLNHVLRENGEREDTNARGRKSRKENEQQRTKCKNHQRGKKTSPDSLQTVYDEAKYSMYSFSFCYFFLNFFDFFFSKRNGVTPRVRRKYS